MEWYKTLSINQKINLKDFSKIILGLSFNDLRLFFDLKEIIEMLHTKLKQEGFNV